MSRLPFLCAIVLMALHAGGCGGGGGEKADKDKSAKKDPHAGHDHSQGPHGGHVVELGKEEAHAEWLHDDDTGKLTIYICDEHNKDVVPIAADAITIVTKTGDKSEAIKIPAVRDANAKTTAHFEIVNKVLIERLKMAGIGVDAHITVDFNGKQLEGHFRKHVH